MSGETNIWIFIDAPRPLTSNILYVTSKPPSPSVRGLKNRIPWELTIIIIIIIIIAVKVVEGSGAGAVAFVLMFSGGSASSVPKPDRVLELLMEGMKNGRTLEKIEPALNSSLSANSKTTC